MRRAVVGGAVVGGAVVRVVSAVALGVTLFGCGGATPAAKAPEKCPPQEVTVALLTSKAVNVQEGHGRPVVARIYQLKDDSRLRNATFDAIWKDDKTALGDDLVRVEELQLYPGRRDDKKFERPDTVNHVAVVVLFQNATGKSWVSTVDLPPAPEPGRCYAEDMDPDDVDDRPQQKAVLPFWLDEARIGDGSEHLDECPRAGQACISDAKPVLKKAAPERRP